MKIKQYLLKSLLLKSVLGFLSLGSFLEANLIAQENSLIQIKPDGTKLIQDKEGNLIQINPDGSKLIKKADGSIVEVKSNGIKKSNIAFMARGFNE